MVRALAYAQRAQNPGWGWQYGVRPGRNSTAITCWMLLAFQAAKRTGLPLPRGLSEGALKWFDYTTRELPGKGIVQVGYWRDGPPDPAFPGHERYYRQLPTQEAMTVLCRLQAGQPRGRLVVTGAVRRLLAYPPTSELSSRGRSQTNQLYWLFGARSLHAYKRSAFTCGASHPDRCLQRQRGCWNHALQRVLLAGQRLEGDSAGSWDPDGPWGLAGGRVYATAVATLTLTTYAE